MSAYALLQFLSEALFVLVFVAVGIKALRQPRRANVDTALLFGASALIVAESWVAAVFHLRPGWPVTAVVSSLLMALPYLLVRLVDDFAGVPRPLLRTAEIGLALTAISLVVLPQQMTARLVLLYVAYFVILMVYAAVAFARAAQRSSGVTKRRMQAVATGSFALGLAIFAVGLEGGVPAVRAELGLLYEICALVSGLGYFVGFAPPTWLRRAWQEPEVRAFLGRAASLPRLPNTQAIVRELERGAATSLGAPHASIGLWDEENQALRFERAAGGEPLEWPGGQGIAGRAFSLQRAIFSADAARDDPAHAAAYRESGATAMLAVPITAGEKRLGVLAVYAPRAPIFAEDDLGLAQLLADQAAVILESRALIDEAARVQARDEAARLKDDFLSAAAHDLKTPLTALIVQAQLLEHRARRDPTAPVDPQSIQRILRDAQRLKRLVLDLLDVSRAEQGRLVGVREPVDLVAVAREACATHSTPHHRCVLDAAGEVVGSFDQNRIMQLIDNLLENAIKYGPEGDEVRVRVWHEGDEAHLTVADSGIGIPAADLPHLFDRFHRGSNVDDRRFAGMGLGLFICRGIAEQHGGRIWATSAGPGRGSTFHVVLPLVAPLSTSDVDDGAGHPADALLAATEEMR